MFKTDCESCCFLHDKECTQSQYCIETEDGEIAAPGYCKLHRTKKWENKHLLGADLMSIIKEEIKLVFNLLIIFDEQEHSEKDLFRTIYDTPNLDQYCNKIIIVDITGDETREGKALQYMQKYPYKWDIIADCSTEREGDLLQTVKRISKTVLANYFLVVPAGKIIANLFGMATHLEDVNSRFIYWNIPMLEDETMVVARSYYGLFLTRTFRHIAFNYENAFLDQVNEFEKELGIAISHTFDRCLLHENGR